MKKFRVIIKQVYTVTVEVDAEDNRRALEEAEDAVNEGAVTEPEYDFTMGPETWDVEEA